MCMTISLCLSLCFSVVMLKMEHFIIRCACIYNQEEVHHYPVHLLCLHNTRLNKEEEDAEIERCVEYNINIAPEKQKE